MIKSMTGYGRAEYADEDLKIAVEIKSVNNRYLDIGIKMPRQLGMLEAGIRAELKKYISRGKVDVYITYEDLKEANMQVKYNSKIAGEYLKYLRQMAQEYGLDDDIRVSTLSKYPDVLTMEEEPMDPVQLWDRLRAVVDEAAENFREARVREGEFLRNDLIGKLNEMQGHVDFITERSPQIVAAYRQRLYDKVKELIGDAVIDDSRIDDPLQVRHSGGIRQGDRTQDNCGESQGADPEYRVRKKNGSIQIYQYRFWQYRQRGQDHSHRQSRLRSCKAPCFQGKGGRPDSGRHTGTQDQGCAHYGK